MEPKMLDTTLVSADSRVGTLGTNVIIKMLTKQRCQEELKLHSVLIIS